MGRKKYKVAKVEPDVTEQAKKPEKSAVEAREVLLKTMAGERAEWNRVMHEEPASAEVKKALAATDKSAKDARYKELEARKMRKFNCKIALHVLFHEVQGERVAVMEIEDGIYLNKLVPMVQQRLVVSSKLRLLWLTATGETVPLTSQREFDNFTRECWCTMPWVLHAYEDTKETVQGINLVDESKALFERFDIDNSGTISRAELGHMLKELDLERLQVSEKLLERFIAKEFAR